MSNTAQILTWYARAQIDYISHYMALYAAFNAWYRDTTGSVHDREALNVLRKGHPVWEKYCVGIGMGRMAHYMTLLAEYTQREPLSYATPHWRGVVNNRHDWPSLLEYWYRVRCLVMHGAHINTTYVYLAYETLNIFMDEIIRRERH